MLEGMTVRPAPLVLAVSLLLLHACGGGSGSPPEPEVAAPDVPGGAAETETGGVPEVESPLFARKVETEADLIGGPGAYGEVGKAWVLGNEVARFLVQDAGVSVGLDLYGGNLIDADLVRPGGAPGEDRFRETFPIVDFRVLVPETIEVANDGSAGDEAVLRVRGGLGPSRILDLLDGLAGDADLEVTLDYVVRPGEPVLTLRTTLSNPGPAPVSVAVGDFLAYGKLLRLMTREAGFAPPEDAGTVAALSSRGDHVSYAWGRADGPIDVPLSDGSGTAALLSFDLEVPAGGSTTFERFLALGDGSPSSALDVVLEKQGEGLGTIEGKVVDHSSGDGPASGIRVTALSTGEGSHAVAEAVSGEGGSFQMGLAPGLYQVVAWAPDRLRSPAATVEVAAGAKTALDLAAGPSATFEVEVTTGGPTTETGATAPVQVSLELLAGEAPDARLGEEVPRGQARIAFLGAGLDAFTVRPGKYRVVVSRGPEYERLVLPSLDVAGGAKVTGHLDRVVDTAGFVACDFHQHTIGSLDSSARLDEKLRENLAAGVECAALTDHDNVIDLSPLVSALGAEPVFHAVAGNEISVNGVGHFNAFPLPIDPADPYALVGAKLWADRTIEELFAALRSLPGDRTLQVNHPRSTPLKGYFTNLRLDPTTALPKAKGQVLALDFDALEVNADLGGAASFTTEGYAGWSADPGESVPVLADWFGLLAAGHAICATGNSDAHDPGDDVGYPRTYLRIPEAGDDPALLTDDLVTAAIRRQHAVVSRGAFLQVDVGGAFRMGLEDPVVPEAPGTPIGLHVRALVPPWLVLDALELYENGLLVETRPAVPPSGAGGDTGSATLWFDGVFDLAPASDAFYVVLARGPELGLPVFGGFTYAFTNPIYVDVAGDGWEPPGGPFPPRR